MNEFNIIWQATGAGVGLVLSSMLYAIGGRTGGPGKWVRRFAGSFILALTIWVVCWLRECFSWGLLGVWPLLSIGYHLGYGADTLPAKIIRRSVYAITVLLAGGLMAWLLSAWAILIPHVGVGLFSVYLGVKNPTEAAFEEFFISMLLGLGLIAYPFTVF